MQKISLKLLLFVSKSDRLSRQAEQTIRKLPLNKGSVRVLDVRKFPRVANRYGIVKVPSLVKKFPQPGAIITGDLRKTNAVIAAISLAVQSQRKSLKKLQHLQRALPFIPIGKAYREQITWA